MRVLPELHEHLVRGERHAEPLRRRGGDARGEAIGPLGVSFPQSTVEIREQLHGGVTSLAEELPRALAAELEVRDPVRIEKHHGLGVHAAILDDAERQHIHARLPGELGGGNLLRHERIREARAVHVHRQAAFVGDPGEHADLFGCVDRAALGRLRDRQHARLDAMHVRLEPRRAAPPDRRAVSSRPRHRPAKAWRHP